MPRVISYTRFSSKKQAAGDSYRRQTEMAMRWCREHGHELDTSLVLEDLGISAYSGANAARGALAALRRLAEDGKLEPGTILLLEALDRLTRLSLPDAYELLLSLINNGLTLVTLTDGKVWNKATMSSLEAFLLSLVTLYRGNQESEYKSTRLRAVFGEARATRSQKAFGSAPGWLRRASKESPWEVIPERAESVRKVFELAAAGLGGKAIAQRANAERWPVPTRLQQTGDRWHAQMPGVLLRNRAVLGEHEHRIRTHEANGKHWHGESAGIIYPDYYPRIIDDDLWHRARAAIEARRTATGRRDVNYFNVWAGMLYCGRCGAPIQRKHETRGYSRAQLTCSDRIAGASECPTGSAKKTDKWLLDAILMASAELLSGDPTRDWQGEIAALEVRVAEKQRESERVADAIVASGGPVAVLAKRAAALQAELDVLQVELDKLRRDCAVSGASDGAALANVLPDDEALDELLYAATDEARDARAALHLRIARLVDTIWLWPYDVALVQLKHRPDAYLKVHLPPKTQAPRKKAAEPVPADSDEFDDWKEGWGTDTLYSRLADWNMLTPPEPRRAPGKLMAPAKPYLLSENAPVPDEAPPQANIEAPPVDWGDEDAI